MTVEESHENKNYSILRIPKRELPGDRLLSVALNFTSKQLDLNICSILPPVLSLNPVSCGQNGKAFEPSRRLV